MPDTPHTPHSCPPRCQSSHRRCTPPPPSHLAHRPMAGLQWAARQRPRSRIGVLRGTNAWQTARFPRRRYRLDRGSRSSSPMLRRQSEPGLPPAAVQRTGLADSRAQVAQMSCARCSVIPQSPAARCSANPCSPSSRSPALPATRARRCWGATRSRSRMSVPLQHESDSRLRWAQGSSPESSPRSPRPSRSRSRPHSQTAGTGECASPRCPCRRSRCAPRAALVRPECLH